MKKLETSEETERKFEKGCIVLLGALTVVGGCLLGEHFRLKEAQKMLNSQKQVLEAAKRALESSTYVLEKVVLGR